MKFTDSHEWVLNETESIVFIGITNFAQKELGEIVYIELPKVGCEVHAQQEIAVLESTKSAVDIYSPVSGKIIEINTRLLETPQLINQDPEKQGWICKIQLSNLSELKSLLSLSSYKEFAN